MDALEDGQWEPIYTLKSHDAVMWVNTRNGETLTALEMEWRQKDWDNITKAEHLAHRGLAAQTTEMDRLVRYGSTWSDPAPEPRQVHGAIRLQACPRREALDAWHVEHGLAPLVWGPPCDTPGCCAPPPPPPLWVRLVEAVGRMLAAMVWAIGRVAALGIHHLGTLRTAALFILMAFLAVWIIGGLVDLAVAGATWFLDGFGVLDSTTPSISESFREGVEAGRTGPVGPPVEATP